MANKPSKSISNKINTKNDKRRVEIYTGALLKINEKLKRELTERKKYEEELRASELIYSNLVEKGNDGIIIIQNGLLKFVNSTISKITGYSKDDAINKPFIQFVAPQFQKLVIERYKKRLKREVVSNKYEIGILSKKGEEIPVEVNASLIMYKGKMADMAIIRDITERKKVETVLTEERNKLNAIYKSTKEGLALYGKEGKVIYMNPALKKLFGVKAELIGVKREEIVRNRKKYFKYYLERFDDSLSTQKKVYSGKTVSNILMKLHTRPPKYLEGNYVPIKDADKNIIGMSASFRDVTILKNQAEKIEKQLLEVERQKNRMQAIFENVEEGTHIIDQNQKIIQANSACELMAGYSESDMVGKKYYEIFGCHDRFGHFYPEFNPVSKVLVTKESIPYDEHLHTCKDGKERWVGVSYTPILNQKGETDQIISVIRDITVIKELDKAKSEFVSLASHELRTPLTIINGYLSLLLNGDLGNLGNKKTGSNFMTVLNKIQNETNRLTKLVGDLLNVSRIEGGRIKLNRKRIDPLKIITEVNEELRPIAAMKGVRMLIRNGMTGNSKQYSILADKDRFKQILVNLLDNSIKFTESGDKITTTYFRRNGRLVIEVEDTGAGIPESVLPRVFEKFQQATGSYLKENKGTGLGLFIVKSLLKLHNGDIWVSSQVGKGTKFSFYLPIVAA